MVMDSAEGLILGRLAPGLGDDCCIVCYQNSRIINKRKENKDERLSHGIKKRLTASTRQTPRADSTNRIPSQKRASLSKSGNKVGISDYPWCPCVSGKHPNST